MFLGKINLIQINTNRNSSRGAWLYEINENASPETIDWEQFIRPTSKRPFDPNRFFRWRCWWDYGTGISGDLMTHEFDVINQVMDLGIPRSAMASGGIYHFKDGREVPDVLQVVFEYPDRELTLIYSATLANQKVRPTVFMGHDASMELGGNMLSVFPDPRSEKYEKQIKDGIIDLSTPILTIGPDNKGVDLTTSATAKYFAQKGLIYTNKNGKKIDLTHLHINEWLDCIRNGNQASCNIERGFQEAITAHMATLSYREGRKVIWDQKNNKIV